MAVSAEELEKVESVLSTLVSWSGVSDDTPDDTDILECDGSAITLGDLRDCFTTLQKIRESKLAS